VSYEALRPLFLLEQCEFWSADCLSEPDIGEAEAILGRQLPPSFRSWLLEIGDATSLYGGSLSINTLLGPPDSMCIVHATPFLNRHRWELDPDLIVFARSGRETLWAFDSAVLVHDEYPVIEVAEMISQEGRKYMLWNTSFHRFIACQALFWTRDLHPTLPELTDTAQLWIEANQLFDPCIDVSVSDVYTRPSTISEVRALLRARAHA
jgi:hypothetical protein